MKFNKGFTLVELMVTIAVAGVIASLAVPNISKWINKSNLKSYTQKTAIELTEKRNQARTSGQDLNYPIVGVTNISITKKAGTPKDTSKPNTVFFDKTGKSSSRLTYEIKSTKVTDKYEVIVPIYGKAIYRKK